MQAMRAREGWAGPGAALAVAAIAALAILRVVPGLSEPLSFDGANAYLPMARKLLADGPAYLSRPESIAYAPFAYIYPALLGAAETLVRHANVALFGATVALAYLAMRMAFDRRVALVAAALVATAPALPPFVANVLTEPPFLFLLAAWLACVSWALARGSNAAMVLGAAMLALAALTRPAVVYFPAVACALFAFAAWRDPVGRRGDARLAGMHGLAFALCAAVILRNALAFGYPAISTGAGGALFLGVNALVDGFDPAYYGLDYDVGAATGGLDHLSIAGDRLLRGAAVEEIRATSAPALAMMLLRKVAAFLLVAPQALAPHELAAVRAWRIAALLLAAIAVVAHRRSRITLLLALFVAYATAVHAPLLYHHRYSVGMLELPLALLAAIGLGALLPEPRRLALAGAAIAVAVAAGLALWRDGAPASPHPERSPHVVVWARDAAGLPLVAATGMTREAAGSFRVESAGGHLDVAVSDAPLFHPWDISMVTVQVGAPGCAAMVLRYRSAAESGYAPGRALRVDLPVGPGMRAITVGAAAPLRINHEGVMRIEFDCAALPATVEIGRIVISAPRRGVHYRARHLERIAAPR